MDLFSKINTSQIVLTLLFLYFVGGAIFSKRWFVRRSYLTIVLAFICMHAIGYLPKYIPALEPFLQRPAADQLIYFFAAMALLGIFFIVQNAKATDEQLEDEQGQLNLIIRVQRSGTLQWWSLVLGVSLVLSTAIQFGLARYPETTNKVFEEIAGPGMKVVNDKIDCESSRKKFKDTLRLQDREENIREFERLWSLDPC